MQSRQHRGQGTVRYRRDIGTRALLDRRIAHMKELQ